MKHKYAEMIKEKVDNMDLVLLVKVDGEWKRSQNNLPALSDLDYFLCHPEHVRETIHWLNGGEVIFEFYSDEFIEIREDGDQWSPHLWCMQGKFESRIKPKKEKRWIVVSKSQGSGRGVIFNDCSGAYKLKSDAIDARNALFGLKVDTQIIEIEIEVE